MTIYLFKVKSLVLFAFLLVIMTSNAQQTLPSKNLNPLQKCATDLMMEEKMQDPVFAQKYALQQETISARMQNSSLAPCINPLIIPVVIHFESSSISNSCMISSTITQLDQMNADFSGCNSNAGLLCDWINAGCTNFGGTAGAAAMPDDGACIQFCLADQNLPNDGNLISGGLAITTGYDTGSQNAPSLWHGFLNIYVGDAGGGILGFVPYLSGASNTNTTDGASVATSAYGSQTFTGCEGVGTGAPYNGGATLSHEVGHWFGLEHTFSDSYADTPPQSSPNYGCPTVNTNSCTSSVGSDYSGNFMDYVDDDCMFTFTQDQVETMLATSAPQAQWANNSISCSVQYPPCGASQFGACGFSANFAPADLEVIDICLDDGNTLELIDLSASSATSWSWAISASSGDLVFSLAMSSSQNPIVSFTSGTSGVLSISLTACDASSTCETITHTITVNLYSGVQCNLECPGQSELLNESFDGCSLPTGWTTSHTNTNGGVDAVGTCNDGTNLFAFDCTSYPEGGPGNANFDGCVAVMDDDNPGSANDPNGIACIISPQLDLSQCTAGTLSFDWEHIALGGSELYTEITSDGINWTSVQSSLATESGSESVSLNSFTSTFQVRVCFDDANGWQWGVAFDNVLVCADCSTGCPDTLVINNLIPDDNYSAGLLIVSDGQVPSGGNVSMEAGAEIELAPGFDADENSDVYIFIGGCLQRAAVSE